MSFILYKYTTQSTYLSNRKSNISQPAWSVDKRAGKRIPVPGEGSCDQSTANYHDALCNRPVHIVLRSLQSTARALVHVWAQDTGGERRPATRDFGNDSRWGHSRGNPELC
jgi:hypothetical protein